MRQITKTIQMEIDKKTYSFRIKKLDAFSGASLLRIISGYVDSGSGEDLVLSVFSFREQADPKNPSRIRTPAKIAHPTFCDLTITKTPPSCYYFGLYTEEKSRK